jgi:hypothetical protein
VKRELNLPVIFADQLNEIAVFSAVGRSSKGAKPVWPLRLDVRGFLERTSNIIGIRWSCCGVDSHRELTLH